MLQDKGRRILEITIVICIFVLSFVVFALRYRIQNVSNIGYLGLFLLCFLANSTVLLPAPSLMLAASCALIMNPWLVALFGSLGSALGEFVGYVFGAVAKDLSPKLKNIVEKVTDKIHSSTMLVFILAVLPLPLFDVAGIYSGCTKMNKANFFMACWLGKFIKMAVYTRIYSLLEWATTLMYR